MVILDKLNNLMKEKNLNKSTLAKKSGIPYTTIIGFYTKGTDNIKLSTLKKLSAFFDCSLDYLVDDNVTEKKPLTYKDLNVQEKTLLENYRNLSKNKQYKVNIMINLEINEQQEDYAKNQYLKIIKNDINNDDN